MMGGDPRKWVRVRDDLVRQVEAGELGMGDTFAVAGLARQYGFSRGPVRRAARDLAERGIVAETGAGKFIVLTDHVPEDDGDGPGTGTGMQAGTEAAGEPAGTAADQFCAHLEKLCEFIARLEARVSSLDDHVTLLLRGPGNPDN